MKLFLFSAMLLFSSFVFPQVGIGTTNPQGALDVTSTTDGFLIPRVPLTVGTANALPLTAPITSEIIYNTATVGGATPGFYYWNGSSWVRFATGVTTGWLTAGNTVGAATSFIGTLDNFDVAFKRSNTAAGFIGATNTAFGVSSLAANSGTNNTAFGTNALAANNSPGDNTAIGYNALAANTLNSGAGNKNTAVGSSSLAALNGGARNTAVGALALSGVNGNASLDNVAVGHNALPGGGTIDQSVAIGSNALSGSGTGSTRSTAIGYNAGNAISTSIDNVIIGWSAQGSGATARNQIVVGAGASANADNTITLGNGSITTLRCQATTITALSDRRDKADIVTLAEGIEFIKKLKPVTFTWNTRDKSKVGAKAAGFIAQDLLDLQQKSAIGENLDLVTYNNPERLEARYGNLLPVIVKGIQEQQEEIEALRKANAELMKMNEVIMKRLEALENKK
ncbi:tail fiber domain-containing protein [Flavobacterium sp. N1994]|uniref:tail fiber domain-containing protein n=1 Tax=Flavobacterium sp. N1994 TaxID=2986827 RepID=UPI002222537F|nr:tail fiber domain-containing protein [Flavobacterium sp. N1994]